MRDFHLSSVLIPFLADGYVKASPANQRAVLEAVEALRRAGHECVEFRFLQGSPRRSSVSVIPAISPSLTAAEAVELYMSITTADGLKTVQEPMKGDPLVSYRCRCGPARS